MVKKKAAALLPTADYSGLLGAVVSLLELGGDFTFIGRQRRLRVGDMWYRIDLLF